MRSLLRGSVPWIGAAAVLLGAQLHLTAQGLSGPGKPTSTTNHGKAAKAWIAPRTADDRPDLRGIWSNASLTPFERPKEFAGKEFFTKEEAAEYARKVMEQSNRDRRGATPEEDVGGAYNEAGSTVERKLARTCARRLWWTRRMERCRS